MIKNPRRKELRLMWAYGASDYRLAARANMHKGRAIDHVAPPVIALPDETEQGPLLRKLNLLMQFLDNMCWHVQSNNAYRAWAEVERFRLRAIQAGLGHLLRDDTVPAP